MLDAIPCNGAGQAGCGNAISAGVALAGSSMVYYESVDPSNSTGYAQSDKMWFYHNSSSSVSDPNNNVLMYNAASAGYARGSISTTSTLLYYLSGGGLAANGLYYTRAFSGSYGFFFPNGGASISNTCDANPYMNSSMSNVCAMSGMRLPKITEIRASQDITGWHWAYNPCGQEGGANSIPITSTYSGSTMIGTASCNTGYSTANGGGFWAVFGDNYGDYYGVSAQGSALTQTFICVR